MNYIIAFSIGEEYAQEVSDTLSLTSIISKMGNKVSLVTLSITDAFSRVATLHKIYTEAISLLDTFDYMLVYLRTFSESISITPAIVRAIARIKAETISITASVSNKGKKTFAEAVTLTDSIIKRIVYWLRKSEVIHVTASVTRKATKVISNTITLVQTFSRRWTKNVTILLSITITPTLAKQKFLTRVYSDTLSIIDSVTRSIKERLRNALDILKTHVRIDRVESKPQISKGKDADRPHVH
jgi:hypothetical protein